MRFAQRRCPAHGGARDQYSSASIIVKTRAVFDGWLDLPIRTPCSNVAIELENELSPRENEVGEFVLATRVVVVVEVGERRHARGQGVDACGHRHPERVVEGPDLPGAHDAP